VHVHDALRNRQAESRQLIQRHEAELRQLEAQIMDDQKSLNSGVKVFCASSRSCFQGRNKDDIYSFTVEFIHRRLSHSGEYISVREVLKTSRPLRRNADGLSELSVYQ
jgi:hypothetical protein